MFALVAVLAQKTAPPVLFLKDNLLSHNEIRRVPCGALFLCRECFLPYPELFTRSLCLLPGKSQSPSYDAIRYNIPRYKDCDTTGDTIVLVSFSASYLYRRWTKAQFLFDNGCRPTLVEAYLKSSTEKYWNRNCNKLWNVQKCALLSQRWRKVCPCTMTIQL